MKTYVLKLDESHEELIRALAKALKIEIHVLDEATGDVALLKAMEEGKSYGRLSDSEQTSFLDDLGK